MIAEMNQVGVDIGVLQCDHIYSNLDKYFSAAMKAYPGRFIGLAQIWEPETNDPKLLDAFEHAILECGNQDPTSRLRLFQSYSRISI